MVSHQVFPICSRPLSYAGNLRHAWLRIVRHLSMRTSKRPLSNYNNSLFSNLTSNRVLPELALALDQAYCWHGREFEKRAIGLDAHSASQRMIFIALRGPSLVGRFVVIRPCPAKQLTSYIQCMLFGIG